MKISYKITILVVSFVLVVLGLAGPIAANAATTPSLGAATTYGVLATTFSNSWAATTINGDVGFTIFPATPPLGLHTNYGSGAPYSTAGTDQASALSALAAEGCSTTFAGAVDLSTDITHGPVGMFTPGVYCSVGAMSVSGPLTLSGSGTYIFRSGGALNTTDGSIITMMGASACDVFWTASAAATLGANTHFEGTIIDDAGITVGANTTWSGRALAFAEHVTTGDTDTITVPSCVANPTLRVIKTVNGGTSTPSNFLLYVKHGVTNVGGSPAAGTGAGTLYTLPASAYVVSEDANASYTQTISGACDSSGNVTLLAGDNKTCTITNDYIPPAPVTSTLHVIKLVIGGTALPPAFNVYVKFSGNNVTGSPMAGTSTPGTSYTLPVGTYVVSEDANAAYVRTFTGACDSSGSVTLAGVDRTCTIVNTAIPLAPPASGGSVSTPLRIVPLIGIRKVPSPLAIPTPSGAVTYNYTVWNVGGQQALVDVSVTDDKCSPVTLVSGDTNSNGKLDISEQWKYSCATTLSTTTVNTAIATGYSDDSYHQAAIATAIATVVVGSPLPPPLINIVKVPSRLTPFPFGGGDVTYKYTVTNPGVVAMHDVTVTDDHCGPVTLVSGDTNGNNLLDTSETWIFNCRTNVSATTRNIATAEGVANGFTAIGYAFADVLVLGTPPALPSTGLPPKDNSTPWNIVVAAGILMLVSISLVLVLKKRKI